MSLLNEAKEAKRKELIEHLKSVGVQGISDGRSVQELALSELQDLAKGIS